MLRGFIFLIALVWCAFPARAGTVDDCLKAKSYKKRISACTTLIGRAKNNPKALSAAYTARANARILDGDLQRALADLTLAIKHNPRSDNPFARRALVRSKLGDNKNAIVDFDEAIRLNPKNAEHYFKRGLLLGVRNIYFSAIADFSQTIKLNPGHAAAYTFRGRMYQQIRQYKQAMADYSKAIALNPRDKTPRDLLTRLEARPKKKTSTLVQDMVVCSGAFGDGKIPIAACSKIIRTGTADRAILIQAYSARARHYGKLGDNDRQRADTGKVRELTSRKSTEVPVSTAQARPPARAGPADTCFKVKDSSKRRIDACTVLIKSLKQNRKGLSGAYTSRADAHKFGGDLQRALADLNQAIKHDPRNELAYGLRASVHQILRDNSRALADYDEAIRLNPKNANYYFQRAALRTLKRIYVGAIADLNQTIKLNPGHAAAYTFRGQIYQQTGRQEQAIADYRKAIALNPGDKRPRDSLKGLEARSSADSAGQRRQAIIRRLLKDQGDCANQKHDPKGSIEACTRYIESALRENPEVVKSVSNKKVLSLVYVRRGLSYELVAQKSNAISDYRIAYKLDNNNKIATRRLKRHGIALAQARPPARSGSVALGLSDQPKPVIDRLFDFVNRNLVVTIIFSLILMVWAFETIRACHRFMRGEKFDARTWIVVGLAVAMLAGASFMILPGQFNKALERAELVAKKHNQTSAERAGAQPAAAKTDRSAPRKQPVVAPSLQATGLNRIARAFTGIPFVPHLIGWMILALIVIFPLWKIHRRAGLSPALALFIFTPYLGALIVMLVLAFRPWPSLGIPPGQQQT